FYLRVAERILSTPLDPYGGTIVWDSAGSPPRSVFREGHSPPLWCYLLAGTIRWLAPLREEWKLHLLQSVFAWWATFGVYQIGRRFTRRPLWCTATIMLGPFVLPGQNLMLECSLLCWWV